MHIYVTRTLFYFSILFTVIISLISLFVPYSYHTFLWSGCVFRYNARVWIATANERAHHRIPNSILWQASRSPKVAPPFYEQERKETWNSFWWGRICDFALPIWSNMRIYDYISTRFSRYAMKYILPEDVFSTI